MKAILVTYNLKNKEDRPTLVERIKSHSSWAKVIDNTWIILTETEPGVLRDELRSGLDNKLNILTVEITNQGWGTYAISKEVTDWMKKNLKQVK